MVGNKHRLHVRQWSKMNVKVSCEQVHYITMIMSARGMHQTIMLRNDSDIEQNTSPEAPCCVKSNVYFMQSL